MCTFLVTIPVHCTIPCTAQKGKQLEVTFINGRIRVIFVYYFWGIFNYKYELVLDICVPHFFTQVHKRDILELHVKYLQHGNKAIFIWI
jgi:hypothetical protein